MKAAAFCIKRRVTTAMLFIVIVVFGVIGFQSLALDLMPAIEMPMAMIMTTYVGAGPSEVENLVTRPLESAVSSVSGMDEMQSSSSENASMIMVTFVDGTDMDAAMIDLRDKVDRVKSALPDGVAAPVLMAMNPDMMPVVQYALEGDNLSSLQTLAEDSLSPALERIDGVASVDIYGGYTDEVVIQTYADRMRGYNLSISYVAQMLTAANVALPAGDVQNGSQSLTVRTTGEYQSVEEIASTIIPLPTGGTIRLSEIADVHMANKDQSDVAKSGSRPCLIIAVNKQSGVNTVQVSERVHRAMNRFTGEHEGLRTVVVMDQADYINLSVDSVLQNIVLGVLLAGVVLFVFLRSPGSTLVISLSMPVCIVATFLIMKMLNLTMNMMSLGGMAMGVGMIVDNSIVVLENIYRFRDDGKSRWEACVYGAGEVSLSITASTLTTVAVFLPIGLSGGMAGMMFKEFTLTIAALMVSSLLIALTLVPLLCYLLLDRGNQPKKLKKRFEKSKKPRKTPIMNLYRKVLSFLIHHRLIACLLSFALFVGFVISAAGAGVELMPTMDQSMLTINISMPVGSELREVEALSDRVVDRVTETIPNELSEIYYYASDAESSTIYVNLVPISERTRTATALGDLVRPALSGIAGAEISVSSAGMMDMSAMTGNAIHVQIIGDDYELLGEVADDLVDKIAAVPHATEVTSSMSVRVPQVEITLKRDTAANFGLTAASIGQAVRGQLEGNTATTLKLKGNEIDVVVRGDKAAASSLDALKTIPIPTQTGGSVPLELVADVHVALAPQTIVRENQSRVVTISGDMEGDGSIYELMAGVQQVLDTYEMPSGISFNTGGESEEMAETFGTLGVALVVAIFLVYFVLASQFESFVMPVIIMMILPLGLMGGLFGLPVSGNPISMPAFIGVIMLAGIVVNSSIVLIDYIKTRRGRGETKNEAILNACPRRVRPVLMTAMTTILGLMPMAVGMGEGNEMMAPMAIVMIAGMVISTIVTLLFTPVYYSVVDSITQKFRKHDPGEPPMAEEQRELQEALSVPGITE